MNRIVRVLVTVIALVVLLPGCGDPGEKISRVEPADTIIKNARVYTMNEQQVWAQGIAIQGDKIVFVGSSNELEPYRGDNTQVIDLAGKMVLPGLFDAHVHPVLAGVEQKYDCAFMPSASPEQIAATISGCVADLPEAQWIVGGRWDSNFFIRHNIDSPRKWLDAISGDKAVSLQDDTGHNRWVNSKALALAELDEATDISGGEVVVGAKTGEPNGLLFEAAMVPVLKLIPQRTAAEYQAAAQAVLAQASRYGITGVKEAGDSHHGVMAYKALDDAGKLNQHMAVAIAIPLMDDGVSLDQQRLQTLRSQNKGRHTNTDFVKLFLDGVPAAPRTAAMIDNYLPEHEGGHVHSGELLIPADVLAKQVALLDSLGITVNIHAAGDRAVRVALDAIEHTRKVNGRSGLRHELAHAGFIDPVDIPRFAALNVVADQSPAIWFPSPIIESVVGALGERGEHYFPFKDLLEAGVEVTVGSDLPAVLPDMNPWRGIEAMVTRQDPEGVFPGSYWQEQAIPLAQALRISTLGGARALKIESKTGSIEAGKLADLIVIDRNLFEIPASDIGQTQVEMTLFEGKLVYQRSAEPAQ